MSKIVPRTPLITMEFARIAIHNALIARMINPALHVPMEPSSYKENAH